MVEIISSLQLGVGFVHAYVCSVPSKPFPVLGKFMCRNGSVAISPSIISVVLRSSISYDATTIICSVRMLLGDIRRGSPLQKTLLCVRVVSPVSVVDMKFFPSLMACCCPFWV